VLSYPSPPLRTRGGCSYSEISVCLAHSVGALPSVRLGRAGNFGAAGGYSHPGRVLLREWRMGRSLQDLEQFDVEDQGAVRRDAAGGAPAVGQIRGNVEAPFGTFLHQLQCFGPAGDNAAYRE